MSGKTLLIIISLSLCTLCVKAQDAVLGGKVLDKDGRGIEGAVVSWLSLPDSTLIVNGITDAEGVFLLTSNSPVADSTVAVASSVGYHPTVQPVQGTDRKDLQFIMQEVAHQLQGVTVTAKSTMKGIAGGYAFTPQGVDLLLTNGYELLRNVPILQVNDGNIELIGKSGVYLYLNGKDPHMSQSMVLELLKACKPSDVERVDLIFSPGSSLAASDMHGIVNIVLKRRPDYGFLGSARAEGGFYNGKYTVGASSTVFYSHGKFRMSGEFSLSDQATSQKYENQYEYLDLGKTVSESRREGSHNTSSLLGIVSTYAISDKVEIGAAASISMEHKGGTTDVLSQMTLADGTTGSYTSRQRRHDPFRLPASVGGQTFLSWVTDAQHSTLDVSASYYWSQSKERNDLSYAGTLPDEGLSVPFTDNTGTLTRAWQGDVKRERHYSNGGQLRYGTQINVTRTDNDYRHYVQEGDAFVRDDGQTNHFVYDETVAAAYASYTRQWIPALYSRLGLRAEYTHTRGDQRATAETFSHDYFHVFPDVSLTLNLADGKHSLGLDYSAYLYRARYLWLNPFKQWISPTAYRVGTPDMKPQLQHSINFRYSLLRDYTLFLGVDWQSNLLTDFTKDDGQGNTMTKYLPYGDRVNYNVAFDVSKSLLRGRWRLQVQPSVYFFSEKGSLEGIKRDRNSTFFQVRVNNMFYLDKYYNSGLSLYYNWNGSKHEAAKSQTSEHHISASYFKQFRWYGMLYVSLIKNITGSQKWSFASDTYRNTIHLTNPGFILTVTYRQSFGKAHVKQTYARGGNDFRGRMMRD